MSEIRLQLTHGFIDENAVYYAEPTIALYLPLNISIEQVVTEIFNAMKDYEHCQFISARFVWNNVCYECKLVDDMPCLTATEDGFTVTLAWFMNIPNPELKIDRRDRLTEQERDAYRAPHLRYFDENGNRRN